MLKIFPNIIPSVANNRDYQNDKVINNFSPGGQIDRINRGSNVLDNSLTGVKQPIVIITDRKITIDSFLRESMGQPFIFLIGDKSEVFRCIYWQWKTIGNFKWQFTADFNRCQPGIFQYTN
jgi:hypothetical protein